MSQGDVDTQSLRILACDIIQNAGILLKLPQIAIATAQMLLQRVYYTPEYTFERYDIDITAMAALFLAAKIEETARRASEVIDVFVYVVSSKLRRQTTLNFEQYEKVRIELITAERRLLKNLGFNLLSNYPHKIILTYYELLVRKLDPANNVWKVPEINQLLQSAWNCCNDSLRTDVFVRFSKEAVACACIQMACERTQMLFPKSSDGREWYQLWVDDVAEVKAATKIIKDLYQRNEPDPRELRHSIYLYKRILRH